MSITEKVRDTLTDFIFYMIASIRVLSSNFTVRMPASLSAFLWVKGDSPQCGEMSA